MNEIINKFIAWHSSQFTTELAGMSATGEILELYLPALDKDGQQLSIFITESSGKFIASDNGNTIRSMRASGSTISFAELVKFFKVAEFYRLKLDLKGAEIYFETDMSNHLEIFYNLSNMMSAIQEIDCMRITNKPKVK